MSIKLSLLASAKVNLALEILGKRSDGFYEIRSVVQTVGLYDLVEAEPSEQIRLNMSEVVAPPDENIVVRAAERLRSSLGASQGAHLRLAKGIPVGAGLGGGSSDAAATLRLLQRLWRINFPASQAVALAAELGSDVPLFLTTSAGLVSGRGEQVEPLPRLAAGWFVLVVPPWREPRKTARVYEVVSPSDFSRGEIVCKLADMLRSDLTPDQAMLVNGLQQAARRVFPELTELHARLEDTTGAPFTLTGAGPSLFHLARSRAEAERVAGAARSLAATVEVVRPLARRPRIRAAGPTADSPPRTLPSKTRHRRVALCR